MSDTIKPSKILVTGTAGFIGFHLASNILAEGHELVGLDVINAYYDVELKYARLKQHGIDAEKMSERQIISSSVFPNYRFLKANLQDHDFLVEFMKAEKFDYVVNLAAQAGVRYSLENPRAYTDSNINGFLSILEGCRYSNVKHLVYASTSSVYGLNTQMPLSEKMPTEHPMTLYAATKKANEMFAHSYSHLFQLPTTGLRFFTVYGPWGRPDMALFLFTKSILKGEPINVFNFGNMIRDFTYVEDIAESVKRLIFKPASPNPLWDGSNPESPSSSSPYQVFNIGNSNPVKLSEYIDAVEAELGIEAIRNLMEIQPGDVPATHADVSSLENYIQFKPATPVRVGVKKFVEWYKMFYKAGHSGS